MTKYENKITKVTLQKNVNNRIYEVVQKIDKVSEKSESESQRLLCEVRTEFEQIGASRSNDRRQMVDYLQTETQRNNLRSEKVLTNVSERMDELVTDDI